MSCVVPPVLAGLWSLCDEDDVVFLHGRRESCHRGETENRKSASPRARRIVSRAAGWCFLSYVMPVREAVWGVAICLNPVDSPVLRGDCATKALESLIMVTGVPPSMKDISTQVRTTAAMLATAATLFTGCQKRPEAVAPDKGADLAKASLPTAPALAPDKEITALFLDNGLPREVRSALVNPQVHAILHGIWESGKTEQPISYVRNAYAPADGAQTVVVLQHLMNVALPSIVQQGRAHHNELLKVAETQAMPWRQDTLGTAAWLKSYLDAPLPPLGLDGDFGRRCHKRRAMMTQIANLTSHFPHTKEDAGANDTAIGPRTLRLFTETTPAFRRFFEADFAVVVLSHNEAVSRSEARPPAR